MAGTMNFSNFFLSLANICVMFLLTGSNIVTTDTSYNIRSNYMGTGVIKHGRFGPYSPPWIVTKATEALRKAALCMLNEADNNSLLGLAIAAGQLESSLRQLKSSSWLGKSNEIIQELEETIAIIDYVQRELERRGTMLSQQDGSKGLRILNKSFWRFSAPRKQLTVTAECGLFSEREDYDEFLTEKISDKCLLEATQQRIGGCKFSDDCWNAMVANLDCRGYSGTHQLLFMVASWRMQCGRSFLPSLDNLMTNCSNQMFSRFCEIKNSNFPSESQDIFLEYVTMGGLAGFGNFFQEETFLKVLQWQNRDGCFYVKSLKGSLKEEKARAIHKTAIASAFFGVYASHFALV